jgi:hypothetical protein
MLGMLAQSSDTGAVVFSIIFLLAVLALQIYLIYAIIATRQDVRAIRKHLLGASLPSQQPEGPVKLDNIEQLREAAALRESGILSDEEFGRVKEGIVDGWVQTRPRAYASRPEESQWKQDEYTIVIRDFRGVDPMRLARIIRGHVDNFQDERLQTMPCVVADGIGFATAEPLRGALDKAGVLVDMQKQ